MIVSTIYKIERRHQILNYSWKLEKLGFIRIREDGNMKLSLELLVSETMLENLGILTVEPTGQKIKLITQGRALNRLLNKLVTEQVNEGELSETIKQSKQ